MFTTYPEYTPTNIKHETILADEGIYYGWPANNGAWQRVDNNGNDEFLFGVTFGKYDSSVASMHPVSGPLLKGLVRSQDGGLSWKREAAPGHFFPTDALSTRVTTLSPMTEIYRVCGSYDHGGEDCYHLGAYYSSRDFGHTWHGPFKHESLDSLFVYTGRISTSRTCVVGDYVLLSAAVPNVFGSDFVICARIELNSFRFLSVIKPSCSTRCACPSACCDTAGNIYVACRRRNMLTNENWIELFKSVDKGLTWQSVTVVGSTGTKNGNPPSLKLLSDGRLVCAFGNRKTQKMMLAVSDDYGLSWKHLSFRDNLDGHDFGYPQLFVRSDGTLVCVYYWQNEIGVGNTIEASTIIL